MHEAIIILSLLGCDHGEVNCIYIDTVSARYQSVADCEADAGRALLARDDENYPVVMAKCEMRAPVMVVADRAPESAPATAAVAVDPPAPAEDGWFVVRQVSDWVDYAAPVAAKAGQLLDAGYTATGQFATSAWAKLPSLN